MRIKFQEIKANYDYIIVGSGIVGMTILQELIERKKNYEKGKILLNNKTLSFPKLSKNEVELIGGFSDFDTVSYRFLDLKRIGLSQLIKNVVGNKNQKISLLQAYNHFKST